MNGLKLLIVKPDVINFLSYKDQTGVKLIQDIKKISI